MITHSTPDTTPIPVTTLAPTVNSVPQAASGRQLEERAVGIDQQLDSLPGGQAAAVAVPLHIPLAAACQRDLDLLVELREHRELRGPIGPVGVGVGVDAGGQDGHAVSPPVGDHVVDHLAQG